jgi:hypothetical protein
MVLPLTGLIWRFNKYAHLARSFAAPLLLIHLLLNYLLRHSLDQHSLALDENKV